MLQNPRIANALKALLLIAMGLFLYTRIANGSLYFYINQRFVGLTLMAVLGLLIVGISYRLGGADEQEHDHGHDHTYDHTHDHHHHDHHHHDHTHGHNHGLSWLGLSIVALPIILGMAVPPQPLGASALSNREMTASPSGSAMPAAIRAAREKSDVDKNILDWMYEFDADQPASIVGKEADVVGFVFQDEQLAEGEFLLARYVVSCCVADASYVALVVQWPESQALSENQWVRVRGQFELGQDGDNPRPLLIAQDVQPTEMPNQPYLYP
jgi:uncharacterized repeat protein (TIGR03943 family)